MSTVLEIKSAIEKLSPCERAELDSLIWPDWDRVEGDTPPDVREKLAEAAKEGFLPSDCSDITRILVGLGMNLLWDESNFPLGAYSVTTR